ncbi:MAG TPA: YARHG domain-containing protein [Sphingopyxis sp.]|nr:YARHG domain-containing protein [Sphingopyxis sp.]HMP44953.1 YARHG domain-containing protein [Sphingopyxis sp.]HMQ20778.1 YARHG domain-containing protein [Sphingopyxis sp.]
MVDVFISYSRENKDRVAQIAHAVKAAGYDVWWDAELPPHRSYGDVITEKIGMAKAAIVVWSQSSAQSEWVRAEADVARNQKKLVQTAIDDVMPPLPFNQIQFAELADWQGETDHRGWRKVLLSLEDLCGRPPLTGAEPAAAAAPPPPPPPVRQPVADQPAPAAPRASPLPWIVGAVVILGVALAWWLLQPTPVRTVTTGGPGSGQTVAPGTAAGSEQAGPTEAFVLAAVINDPDGFTNIRSGPSAQSEIVGKVLEGEKFLTYQQDGSWWRVRKGDGTTGYMARRLIRILDGPNPDPAPSAARAPAPAAPIGLGGSGVVIPYSSERLLTADDVAYLTAHDLRIARNEIYARKGYRFKDAGLRAHFSQFGWYRATTDNVQLSSVEQANVALLRSAEAAAQ